MGEMKDKMMTGTGQKMKDTVMIKKQARIDEMKVKVKKIFEKVKDEKLVKILEKIAAIKIKISANTKLSDDKKSSLLEQVEAIE